jgi:hypothetical protein
MMHRLKVVVVEERDLENEDVVDSVDEDVSVDQNDLDQVVLNEVFTSITSVRIVTGRRAKSGRRSERQKMKRRWSR